MLLVYNYLYQVQKVIKMSEKIKLFSIDVKN